jgi:hypothetical protein
MMNEEIDFSDIEIELPKPIDDETLNQLQQVNFKQNEHCVGNIPFAHWTINRQMLQS